MKTISTRQTFFKLTTLTLLLLGASASYATDSTSILTTSETPMEHESYVDTRQSGCKTLTSTPYVIALGSGGGNMNLTCPKDIPVMINWHFQVGYGGLGSVVGGYGVTKVTCCPMAVKWVASK